MRIFHHVHLALVCLFVLLCSAVVFAQDDVRDRTEPVNQSIMDELFENRQEDVYSVATGTFEGMSSGTWVEVAHGTFTWDWDRSLNSVHAEIDVISPSQADDRDWNSYASIRRGVSTQVAQDDYNGNTDESGHVLWGWEFSDVALWDSSYNRRIRYKISASNAHNPSMQYYYIPSSAEHFRFALGFGFGAFSRRNEDFFWRTSTDARFIAGCRLELHSDYGSAASQYWYDHIRHCTPIANTPVQPSSLNAPEVYVPNNRRYIELDRAFRLYGAVLEIEAQCTSGQCCRDYMFRPEGIVLQTSYTCDGDSVQKSETYCTGTSGQPATRTEITASCEECSYCEEGKSSCQLLEAGSECGEYGICTADGACSCVDAVWSPEQETVCAGETFIQTSNCGTTREVQGTLCCDSIWTPDVSQVCSQEQIFQVGDCGTERVISGELSCPDAPKNITLHLGQEKLFSHDDFYTDETVVAITEALQDALITCTPDADGYCLLPLDVASLGYGSVILSDVQIYTEKTISCEENCSACTPAWSCGEWGTCMGGTAYRACTDLNYCGSDAGKPAITKACEMPCYPQWHCTDWSSCTDGMQTRTCTDMNTCGIMHDMPDIEQSCIDEPAQPDQYTILLTQGWNHITPISSGGYAIELVPGWNELGYAHPQPLHISNLTFVVTSDLHEYTYYEAVDARVIDPTIYGFAGSESRVPLDDAYLRPGSGYRIFVHQPSTLVIPQVEASTEASAEASVSWEALAVTGKHDASLDRDALLLGYAYRFDALKNAYVYVPDDESDLFSWFGYWVYAFDDAEIVFE